MPIQPTYPGVYIEELKSEVRTITGVSTSVAAFVGPAKRGPIDKAVHILSWADYERRFGGLYADETNGEMSYAVRQFFLNGGTDAWVVRVAKGATKAFLTLNYDQSHQALLITALDAGKSGNRIHVQVDYDTANPASTFNLTLQYTSEDNPADVRTEIFRNLSMNSGDERYVEEVVTSQLVTVQRMVDKSVLEHLNAGTSISGEIDISKITSLVDDSHNQLIVWVNGLNPKTVQLDLPPGWENLNSDGPLAYVCDQIRSQVAADETDMALTSFKCELIDGDKKIKMTSGRGGESSWVRVLHGPANDASVPLKLGAAGGGVETDAVAAVRPLESPNHGKWTGGIIASLGSLPTVDSCSFDLILDGTPTLTVNFDKTAITGNLGEKLKKFADSIEKAVRGQRAHPAFAGFTCSPTGDNRLVLTSGTRGAGSSVYVAQHNSDGLAAALNLLAGNNGATLSPGKAQTLDKADEPTVASPELNFKNCSRAAREGIYALEAVDLFNLLCLPGITDSGVLADAVSYCQERRAFLIVDSPTGTDSDPIDPSEMAKKISGTDLPKSDYAAVYYPWIKIANPLKQGKLRKTAPCGTIAGLYARIDSNRGVWKAPAGTEASLAGILDLEYSLTNGENGTLNPLGVNCIRIFPGYGAISWGARTLCKDDTSEWKYIPVRRLALYIEESLYRGTQWVVFEPNDEPLWSQIRLNVGAFMQTLFRQGAFQGKTAREAYLVKCDRETTTQDDVNRGVVNILVGFAPLKPAEFVFIQIQQLAGQVQV